MSVTIRRPDDADLVRQATRAVRSESGASVVFGGLRDDHGIRVSSASGARTDRLRSIEVRPARGLGGIAWESGQPRTVVDYGRAREITHDFDAQILGEGIRALTVVPIIVGGDVRGLLYAGSRESTEEPVGQRELSRVATRVAEELRIRDLVEERLELRLQNADALRMSPELRAELAGIASDSRDPDTARRLRMLLGGGGLEMVPSWSAGAAWSAGSAWPAGSAWSPASPTARGGPGRDGEGLTTRQRDVLGLVAYGLTNAQIAARLGLSELTVKSYLRTVMSGFGVGTRSQAVFEARRRGLL